MNTKELNAKELILPKKHCVYFLTDNKGEIIYVGKTDKLQYRIGEHSYRKSFDRVFYIEYDSTDEMDKKEMEYILKIQPKYNFRIDNPGKLGYISKSEMMLLGRKKGKKLKQIERIIKEKNIGVISLKKVYYFNKKILKYL